MIRIFLALVMLILIPLSVTAQQTDLHISASVKNVKGVPTPKIGGVEVVIQYPKNMVFTSYVLEDNTVQTKSVIQGNATGNLLHIGVVNSTGMDAGNFLKVSFSRSGAGRYSAVTGDPLGEAFKVLDSTVIDLAGVEIPEASVTATKYNWQ